MAIYLCGFMGCGKSTIGKIIAKKLGTPYIDSDIAIVEQTGMTIPQIFQEKGEPYFREIEAEILKSFIKKNIVVACGGGALLNSDTAKAIAVSDRIVFIDIPFEICYSRIANDLNRPIVQASTKSELLEKFNTRHPIYVQNSTFSVDIVSSPLETANIILEALKNI